MAPKAGTHPDKYNGDESRLMRRLANDGPATLKDLTTALWPDNHGKDPTSRTRNALRKPILDGWVYRLDDGRKGPAPELIECLAGRYVPPPASEQPAVTEKAPKAPRAPRAAKPKVEAQKPALATAEALDALFGDQPATASEAAARILVGTGDITVEQAKAGLPVTEAEREPITPPVPPVHSHVEDIAPKDSGVVWTEHEPMAWLEDSKLAAQPEEAPKPNGKAHVMTTPGGYEDTIQVRGKIKKIMKEARSQGGVELKRELKPTEEDEVRGVIALALANMSDSVASRYGELSRGKLIRIKKRPDKALKLIADRALIAYGLPEKVWEVSDA